MIKNRKTIMKVSDKSELRGECLIRGRVFYFDFWNSKEKTEQNDSCEYLGEGRVVSVRGKSKEHEPDEEWSGHFWRIKSIPTTQPYRNKSFNKRNDD